MIKVHKPTILFLMETRLHKNRMEKLKYLFGFPNMLTVEGMGRGGGLALLWQVDCAVAIQSYSQRHISCWVDDISPQPPWMLSCFYGHPLTDKRVEGYNILRHLHSFNPKMWLCIGDFNEILFQSEKEGGAPRFVKQMALFKDVLDECQLRTLHFVNGKYTWCNNRTDSTFTKEKLDRAVASFAWCEEFSLVEIRLLFSVSSYHNPLLLSIPSKHYVSGTLKRPSRFEARWVAYEDYGETLQSSWLQAGGVSRDLPFLSSKLASSMQFLQR
ncbi:hypothetical protein I3760_16G034600 [Carya illinoinensis]|nr:hypothetical protein I3760_16G034600 [Carya illinoinensis]